MDVQLSGTWHAAQSILKEAPCGDCAGDVEIRQPQNAKVIDNRTGRVMAFNAVCDEA